MIRRPKSCDFEEGAVVDTLRACSETVADLTRNARGASAKLVRALILLLVLTAIIVPVLAWLQAELANLPAPLLMFGAALFVGTTFWIFCGAGELSARLRSRRERLEACEDPAEMRARLLSPEATDDRPLSAHSD